VRRKFGSISFGSGPILLNPELDHWFSSGNFLNLNLNQGFRFKRVQFRFRERLNAKPNANAKNRWCLIT
jgi:hypothetical protein